MIYVISENIRVRVCENKCFLVNIKDNSVFMIEKKQLNICKKNLIR